MSNFLKNLHPLIRRKKNPNDNKDPNYAIIDMFNEELNNVEQDTIDSKIQSSLKTATGKYLDIYGDWYGLVRKSKEKDDDYRERIIEYVLLKRGTNNSIIDAIRRFLEDEDVYVDIYEPFQNIFYTNKSHLNGEDHLMGDYYRFAIIDITIGKTFPLSIIEEINKFKPAGVKVYFTYDGSHSLPEDKAVTQFYPKGFPKVSTYQDVDIFRGYGRILYGHLNLGIAKVKDITDVFKTNNSLINSLDVLSGSATVGREFYNYAYKTQNSYVPRMGDFVTTISNETNNIKGEELSKDFYTDTTTRNALTPSDTILGNKQTTNIYFNFDTNEYLRRKGININTLNLSEKELRTYISNYFGNVSLDFDIQAMVSPTRPTKMTLSIYDFISKSWVNISKEEVDLKIKNIGNNLGNLVDYLNNNLAIFIKLEIEPLEEDIEIRIKYLDLHFKRYEKDIYTVKPFLGKVEAHQETEYFSEVDATKDIDIDNGDIMTKSGYQPMQYLRLTDGYDNNINRNLALNSLGGKDLYFANSMGYSYATFYLEHPLEIGKTYYIEFEFYSSNETQSGSLTIRGYNPDDGGNTFKIINNKVKATITPKVPITQILIYKDVIPNASKYLDVEVRNVTVTEKNYVTKWQPNPEDIYGANDPNKYVDLQAKDVDGNKISSEELKENISYEGRNLFQGSQQVYKDKEDTKGNYKQYWFTYINEAHKHFNIGDSITISFDVEMDRGDLLRVYDTNHNRDFMFGSVVFENIGNQKQRLKFTRKLEKATKDTPNWQLAFFADDNGDNFSIKNIKIERGKVATPYTAAPEDDVKFLNKTIMFNGVFNNIQTISILNSIDLEKVYLETSIYGDKYKRLKTLTDIKSGETHTDNDLVDLFGIKNLTYQTLNPFSEVIIRPFLNYTIERLMEDIGNVVDLPKGFFNATWQEIDCYTEVKNPTPIVLDDVANGEIDNSTGEVWKVPVPKVSMYTEVENHSYSPVEYNKTITLDSRETLKELADVKLSTRQISMSRIPKVSTETIVEENK